MNRTYECLKLSLMLLEQDPTDPIYIQEAKKFITQAMTLLEEDSQLSEQNLEEAMAGLQLAMSRLRWINT